MSYLNPKTGDYVLVNGTAKPDPRDGLANAVYVRFTTPLGGYWADKTLGSRFHELKREKDVPRVKSLAIQFAKDALAPLLSARRIKSLDVEAFNPIRGRLELHAVIETLQGNVVRFQHFIQVGG